MHVVELSATTTPGSDGRSAPDDSIDRVIEAVWEDYPDEVYRRDISHWRASARLNEVAWQGMINTIAGRLRDLLRSAGRSPRERLPVGLDWGCGGGASSIALATCCDHVIAVDVSEKNLAETQRQFEIRRREQPDSPASTLSTVLVGSNAVDAIEEIDRPIDLFVSAATFHVFASKRLAADVLRTAFAVMRPGGLGLVQIRYDDGTPRYRPRQDLDRYELDHLFASSWTVGEFWDLIESSGLHPMKVAQLNTAANFAHYHFRK